MMFRHCGFLYLLFQSTHTRLGAVAGASEASALDDLFLTDGCYILPKSKCTL